MIGLSETTSQLTEFLMILFDIMVVIAILPFLFSFAKRIRDIEKEIYLVLNVIRGIKHENK